MNGTKSRTSKGTLLQFLPVIVGDLPGIHSKRKPFSSTNRPRERTDGESFMTNALDRFPMLGSGKSISLSTAIGPFAVERCRQVSDFRTLSCSWHDRSCSSTRSKHDPLSTIHSLDGALSAGAGDDSREAEPTFRASCRALRIASFVAAFTFFRVGKIAGSCERGLS